MPSIKSTLLLVMCVTSASCLSQVELQTKQALSKIRYLSKDGKVTYYQKTSGELQMSTNYSFATIIKGTRNTQYLVNTSTAKKRIIIEADSQHYSHMDLKRNHEIYTANYKDKNPAIKIGSGVSPKLHLEDAWVSYFDFDKNQIKLVSFVSNTSNRIIKLRKHLNAYFTPQVIMLTPNDVFYTDINSTGHMAILSYSFIEKKFITIYKAKSSGHKLNMCQLGNKIIIGEFPYPGVNSGSSIIGIDIFDNNQYKKSSHYYSSPFRDIGHLTCLDKQIYFVKTTSFNKVLLSSTSEVATIDIKTNEVKLLSSLKNISQITSIGEILVATNRGKYYLIKGENTTQADKIIGKGQE